MPLEEYINNKKTQKEELICFIYKLFIFVSRGLIVSITARFSDLIGYRKPWFQYSILWYRLLSSV